MKNLNNGRLMLALREEYHWTSPGTFMGEPRDWHCSQSTEHCFIQGWRAELLLRFARFLGVTWN